MLERNSEVKFPTISIWTDEAAEVGRVREEKGRRKKIREEKESEERKSKSANRSKSRETLYFSNVLWLRKVEK